MKKLLAMKFIHSYLFVDGGDLPEYNARLDSDIIEDIPANTRVSSSNSPLPPPFLLVNHQIAPLRFLI